MIRSACARSCSTHQARSSKAAESNSKFLNGFVERDPLLTLLCFQQAAPHRFRLQEVGRFPFGFDVAPKGDRNNHGGGLTAFRSGSLVDAPLLPAGGSSSFSTSGGGPFPVRIRCRAKGRSEQSRRWAHRFHWRRTGSQHPASSSVYSFRA